MRFSIESSLTRSLCLNLIFTVFAIQLEPHSLNARTSDDIRSVSYTARSESVTIDISFVQASGKKVAFAPFTEIDGQNGAVEQEHIKDRVKDLVMAWKNTLHVVPSIDFENHARVTSPDVDVEFELLEKSSSGDKKYTGKAAWKSKKGAIYGSKNLGGGMLFERDENGN